MGLRKKLYRAAEKFDGQIDGRMKRLPLWVKSALLFLMGFMSSAIGEELKPRSKAAFALGLLGFGLMLIFSVVVFTRPKGRK